MFALSHLEMSDVFQIIATILLLLSVVLPWASLELSGSKYHITAFDQISAWIGYFYVISIVLILFRVTSFKHKEDWKVKLPKYIQAIDFDTFFAVSIGGGAFFIAIVHSGLKILTQDVGILYGPVFGMMAGIFLIVSNAFAKKEKKKDLVDRVYIDHITHENETHEYRDILTSKKEHISDKNLQLPL